MTAWWKDASPTDRITLAAWALFAVFIVYGQAGGGS